MVDLKVPPGTDPGMFGDDDNEDYLDLSKVRSFQIELVKRITKDALDKMKTFNGAMEQNQNAKAQQASSSPIIIGGSTTNNASTKSDLNTFAQAGAHPNKTLVTSMV